MDGREHRQPPLAVQPLHQIEQRRLAGDVQVVRRLVQQQDLRLLRQRHRQHDPLALPPRELPERPPRQRRRPHRRQRPLRDPPVRRRVAAQPVDIGAATQQHQLLYLKVEGDLQSLRHQRDPARQRPLVGGPPRPPADQHLPRLRLQGAAQQPQDRALAGAVRPQQSRAFPRRHGQRQPPQHRRPSVGELHPRQLEGRRGPLRTHSGPSPAAAGGGRTAPPRCP